MSGSSDPLGMPDEELRTLGHWLVDAVVDGARARADGPALTAGDPASLRAALGGAPPRDPGDPAAALRTLLELAAGHMQHGDHPRYFARVPGPSSSAGVLGDWLATGVNAIASSWGGGAGPTTVELVVIGWLAELLGFPPETEGLVTSGGSLGNLTAFAAARAGTGRGDGRSGVVYLSDQGHSSLRRGLATIGVPDGDVRILSTDAAARPVLTAAALAAAVAADRRAGWAPWLVVASAGTTNTGAVDELPGLADVCAAEGLWLHIDGAYGAPAALCEPGRRALAGIERADSLTLDPHKWLFAPYDAGVVLVRRRGALEAAFGMRPEYLADVRARADDDAEVDLGTRGPELTRRARAFKLWMIVRTYGVDAIAAAIERGLGLACHAERLIDADPFWECVTPASLGIVTFTHPGWDAREHADRAAALSADGYAAVTSTTLRGRAALRLCTINPRTTHDDLAETLARLKTPAPGR